MIPAIPSWVAKYVGVPFEDHGRAFTGCDCWGLVLLVYKNEFGIDLPSFDDDYTDAFSCTEISATICQQEQLADVWTKVELPQVGDIVICIVQTLPWHLGVYVGGKRMLHTEKKTDAVIERLDSISWRNRIRGYYRYERK